MTWRYALLAFTIGVLFMVGQTAFAHDADGNPDPPPKTCDDRCKAVQCTCVDACKKLGNEVHQGCFSDCFDQRMACHEGCKPSLRRNATDAPAGAK